jgi:hypothetical protein
MSIFIRIFLMLAECDLNVGNCRNVRKPRLKI